MKNETKKSTLIINFFAGPGAGKSTNAYLLTGILKLLGKDVELVTEYAKDRVWRGDTKVLDNSIYVFGEQYERLDRLVGNVDIIVTDSPIFLSMFYGKKAKEIQTFKNLVFETFKKYNNLNYFIQRTKEYNPKGRLETLEQAKKKDREIKNTLKKYKIDFKEIPYGIKGIFQILKEDLNIQEEELNKFFLLENNENLFKLKSF